MIRPIGPVPGKLAVDLHVHTCFSRDSLTTLPALVEAVGRRGLNALAVTDHNCIEGALRLRDLAPFPVIVGEEVLTSEGEIIGLFLERPVPRRLSPPETIAAIREQGGLLYLPHPADSVRRSTLRWNAVLSVVAQMDLVEVFNARNLRAADNATAQRLAAAYGRPGAGGSDAHTPGEVGQAYTLLPTCDLTSPAAFLAAARGSEVRGTSSSPLVHFSSTAAKIIKRLPQPLRRCP